MSVACAPAAQPSQPRRQQCRLTAGRMRIQKALDPSPPRKATATTREPRVHMIGIGGAGLSPIAHVLLEQGIHVSGSDRQESERTRRLAAAGARILRASGSGRRAQRDCPTGERPDVVLISSAVDESNPERQTAQDAGNTGRQTRVLSSARFSPAATSSQSPAPMARARPPP